MQNCYVFMLTFVSTIVFEHRTICYIHVCHDDIIVIDVAMMTSSLLMSP